MDIISENVQKLQGEMQRLFINKLSKSSIVYFSCDKSGKILWFSKQKSGESAGYFELSLPGDIVSFKVSGSTEVYNAIQISIIRYNADNSKDALAYVAEQVTTMLSAKLNKIVKSYKYYDSDDETVVGFYYEKRFFRKQRLLEITCLHTDIIATLSIVRINKIIDDVIMEKVQEIVARNFRQSTIRII